MDTPSSSLRSTDMESQKYILQAEVVSGDGISLPKTYGDNRLVVMARDPFWFFAYWDMSQDRMQAVGQEHGADIWGRSQTLLRVYDVTDIEFNGSNAHSYHDVGVLFDSYQWYVRVNHPGRHYLVDLGLLLANGRFISLLRSNPLLLPVGRVSDETDSQWMAVSLSEQEEWNKMLQVAVGADSSSRSSSEIVKTMAQRWEFLRAVFSSSSSRLSSSSAWQAPAITNTDSKEVHRG